jgi:hypothetical protein
MICADWLFQQKLQIITRHMKIATMIDKDIDGQLDKISSI